MEAHRTNPSVEDAVQALVWVLAIDEAVLENIKQPAPFVPVVYSVAVVACRKRAGGEGVHCLFDVFGGGAGDMN